MRKIECKRQLYIFTSPVCFRACLAKCSLRVKTISQLPNPVHLNNLGSDLRPDALFFCAMLYTELDEYVVDVGLKEVNLDRLNKGLNIK